MYYVHCVDRSLVLNLSNLSILHFNYKLFVGLLYHPPVNLNVLDDIFSVLETLDVRVLSNFVLLGDFNVEISNTFCTPGCLTFCAAFLLCRLLRSQLISAL